MYRGETCCDASCAPLGADLSQEIEGHVFSLLFANGKRVVRDSGQFAGTAEAALAEHTSSACVLGEWRLHTGKSVATLIRANYDEFTTEINTLNDILLFAL